MDFNKVYSLETPIGTLLIPVIYYNGSLTGITGFLNRANMTYLGNSLDDRETVFQFGFVGGCDPEGRFPSMGQIEISTKDGTQSTFNITANVQSTNCRVTYTYNNVSATSSVSLTLTTGKIRTASIAFVVDENDNFMIVFFQPVGNTSEVSYAGNTATRFGYFEGPADSRQFISAQTLLQGFTDFSNTYISVFKESTDPFEPGGPSEPGGGTGNFDGTSVDVDFTTLPTLSAVDTGFITLYNPTLAQLQSLASYMWSNLFDLDTLKKLFADPMQAILGLSILPGPIPSGASQAVKVGNITTTVTMTKAASQYFDIDCGTLNVEEFWGAYLDYEPYTKAEIYLPYIGTHQIAVDDIMGKAVHIMYHVDILSGACSAEIKCGGSVLYTFIGSVAVSVPVTGNDWTNVINGVLSIAGSIGSMVATGGLSAPSAIGSIASSAVNQLKPSIQKSGSVSGGGGLLAGKAPVLILTRPRQALPASQNEFTGYPAFITRTLGDLSGYTEVHKIRLGGIPATDAELEEIEGLLKGGVIL